eukprot:TRINITY_DN9635_c0_g1_i1.p1 TRINITY_DN9635_c0_g1~~TRINITY_DN9635_c0_g1_i1.p1  ORF type:complete len:988 (-),score=306.83 TRINITY_DN9635_c0_g1_i1:1321-4284(-)
MATAVKNLKAANTSAAQQLGAESDSVHSALHAALLQCVDKLSDDDILVHDDALLLEQFLEVLKDLNGEEVEQAVETCYTLSAAYNSSNDPSDLAKLEEVIDAFSPADSITIASAFSHMLTLTNVAEEIQMAARRRTSEKKGGLDDEASALTESTIKETFMKLIHMGKTKEEIFANIKEQTVDLVLTAHPTQSIRRSLLQKHARIRNLLQQRHAEKLTVDKSAEILEALRREIQAAWRTDEIRRQQPTPQDEMRAGMSYFHETIWRGLPRFLRRVDTALKYIGINERLPYKTPIIQFSTWMGGDRDGNPRVTADVTRDVVLLARLMAANLYCMQIEDLMFELSMWRASDELKAHVQKLMAKSKNDVKHYIEFWKSVPATEPYRVVLSDIRDKLWSTRERAQQLLTAGKSKIPLTDVLTSSEQLMEPLELCYRSLCETGDAAIADGTLLDFLRQVSCFGLSLAKLDVRQESERHTDVMEAITQHIGLGSYKSWTEEKRQEWLVQELKSKRPLFGPDLAMTDEVQEVINTVKLLADLPRDSFSAYVISMATSASHVLEVCLLQHACGVKVPLRVVPLFERLDDLNNSPAAMEQLFKNEFYLERIQGRQEVMIGYSDSGKDAGRLSAAWAMFKAQESLRAVSEKYNVKLTMFHGRGGTVGRGGGPTHLAILSQPPGTVNGSLRVTVQGEVIETSFGEEHLCFRTLQRFTSATLEHGMHPPISPKPEWRALMDAMCTVATEEYRGIVFQDPNFVEYFRMATPEQEYGRMNLGSRPSKRKASGGVSSLRAIPWIFAWTQTRFHLPVWLGFGGALKFAIESDPKNLELLREMYSQWPFFRVTIDLIEMVFAKGDKRVAALYDRLLVKEELKPFGQKLQQKYTETIELLLKVAGHDTVLQHNPTLRQRLDLREPYITPLNVHQALTLRKMRQPGQMSAASMSPKACEEEKEKEKPSKSSAADLVGLNWASEYAPGLEDTLIITMKGIAAGMQNTG